MKVHSRKMSYLYPLANFPEENTLLQEANAAAARLDQKVRALDLPLLSRRERIPVGEFNI